MPIERSAGIISFHNLKNPEFLLLRHPTSGHFKGHWDFPKGNIEKGETEEQAATRELKEETGLSAKLIPGFRVQITYFYRLSGRLIRKEVVYFLAQSPTKEVIISHEHSDFKWLPYEKALAQLTFENSRQELKKASEFLKIL